MLLRPLLITHRLQREPLHIHYTVPSLTEPRMQSKYSLFSDVYTGLNTRPRAHPSKGGHLHNTSP